MTEVAKEKEETGALDESAESIKAKKWDEALEKPALDYSGKATQKKLPPKLVTETKVKTFKFFLMFPKKVNLTPALRVLRR